MTKLKIKYTLLLALPLLLMGTIQVAEQCDAMELKSVLKKELKPDYKYDSSKTTRFIYKTKTQLKEIEVPLYMGEKYRFLFNTDGLTSDSVKVEIFSKPLGHKKRKLLYSIDNKSDENIYLYEPQKSRKLYINYSIPKVDKPTITKDCLVLVIGYKMKTLKDI